MHIPKVKFGEFDEYFWKVIAPREAQENQEKWEQDRAHQDHLDRLSERSEWAKKYYSNESSSSAQEQPPNFSNQNSNSQSQDLNVAINEHLPQLNNYQSSIFPNFS